MSNGSFAFKEDCLPTVHAQSKAIVLVGVEMNGEIARQNQAVAGIWIGRRFQSRPARHGIVDFLGITNAAADERTFQIQSIENGRT